MTKMTQHELDAGYKALAEGDYRTCNRLFRRIRDHVDYLQGNLGLARSYAQRHQFTRAEKLLTSLKIHAAPEDLVLVRLQLGRLYLDSGRCQDALTSFRALYREGLTDVLILLAIVEAQLKHYDDAEKYAREAVAAGVEKADELLGDVLVCQENWSGAVMQFQHVYPSDHSVAGKLGISLVNVDRDEEAIPYLREGIRLGHLGCIRSLVSAYLFTGHYRNGLAFCDMGIRLGQRGLQGLMGVCHMKLGEYEKAREHLQRAVSEHERFHRMYYQLGMCLFELGEYEASLKALKSSIRHHEPGSWFASGRVNKAMKRFAQARRCFRKSAEVEGELSAQASFELGQLCLLEHAYQDAEKYFQDSWLGGFILGGVAMGNYLVQSGNSRGALRWFRQVLEVGYDDVLPALGETLLSLGEHDKAREVFLRAMDKGHESARLGLAMLNEKEGNCEEADRLFEECLEHEIPKTMGHYGEVLLARNDFLGAISYLQSAWEHEHDSSALLPLSYAYTRSSLKDGNTQSIRYLYLAEKMGCLKGKYSRQLKEKLADLMGREG